MMDKKSDQEMVENKDADKEKEKKKKTKEELEREKERRKQKRLDIRAIEFDWIFSTGEGTDFLSTLAYTDNIELFSLKLVRYIIRFLWSYYRMAIVMYLFIPYLIYFTLFILYATWIHDKAFDNNDGKFEGYGLVNTIMIIVLLILIVYFFYFEVRQIIFHKLMYFTSVWNVADLSTLILNSVILIGDLAGLRERYIVTLSGISVLMVWLKLFYFGRIFLSTAAMIRMILEIVADMKYFLLVLLLAIAGFGNCFFILARNFSPMFTGDTWFRAFLYSYNIAMGEFNTDSFEDVDDEHLLYTLWFMNTMITLIIFLNLLIAIMGDTFDRVQETAENNKLKELASIMIENELLINRKSLFGDSKYIIVIQEERAEESIESWEGRLQHLKKYMYNVVESQNKLLKSIEKKIMEEVKEKTEKRGKELEVGASRYINIVWEKTDLLQTMVDEKIAELTPEEEDEKGK